MRDVLKRPIPVEVLSTLLGLLSKDGKKLWILKADVHLHSIGGLRLVHGCTDIIAFTNFIDRDTAISLALKSLDDEVPIVVTPDRYHICTSGVFKPSFQMQDELGQ